MENPADSKPGVTDLLQVMDKEKNVYQLSESYLRYFDQHQEEEQKTQQRKDNAPEITNKYYDLATDFMEYGWGESFHFACLGRGETREHAFAKHEYRLALKLGLRAGDTALDLGCGIGGPARHIAKFSEAKIIGLNNNAYQIARAEKLTKEAGLQDVCSYVKGNFLRAPFGGESFEKVYAIEATCHAPELSQVYAEVYRLLKPGGLFACYEWIMTDKFDPSNDYHKKIKHDILEGDSLPDLHPAAYVLDSFTKVGFEIVEAEDLTHKSDIPWYSLLQAKWTLADFKITPLGRWMTHIMLAAMEVVRLAPRGSVSTHRMLCKGADGLVRGGKEGIFSPMYFVMARKPQ